MTLIWHDVDKERRLARSQPFRADRIDWVVFWTWVGAILLCASVWGVILGRLFR